MRSKGLGSVDVLDTDEHEHVVGELAVEVRDAREQLARFGIDLEPVVVMVMQQLQLLLVVVVVAVAVVDARLVAYQKVDEIRVDVRVDRFDSR